MQGRVRFNPRDFVDCLPCCAPIHFLCASHADNIGTLPSETCPFGGIGNSPFHRLGAGSALAVFDFWLFGRICGTITSLSIPMPMRPASLLLASILLIAGAHGAPDRPNILWITSEDHGQEMGCYGDNLARTPNVDALAAKGMHFRFAWSNHPVCAPARTAIITGLYGASSGGINMRSMVPLQPGVRLFPEYLREAGYYCVNNSKEDYNVPKTSATWDVSSKDAHWRNCPPGKPFFSVFNSVKSHESQLRTKLATQPGSLITDPARVRVPAFHPDTPAVRQDWARYYDIVSAADADAGMHLRELADAGLTEDTIVFYYGDHGSGMPRYKRWPGDSGLRVALVVYFPEKWRHLAPPGYKPGFVSDRLVSFVDLAPTMLSLAGIVPPAWMQGHAFAGTHISPAPRYLFGGRNRMDECLDVARSVTDGRYVYIRNFLPQLSAGQRIAYQFETPTTRIWRQWFDEGRTNAAQSAFWQTPRPAEELYDLNADRDEVHNLAGSAAHADVLARFRETLRAHQLEVRDIALLPEGEMRARLVAHEPVPELGRVLETAELASRATKNEKREIIARLYDPASAVRTWAALGCLIQGATMVKAAEGPLRVALADSSPHVRIAAAQALARYGTPDDAALAKAALRELAPPDRNGVFVALEALNAINDLGALAGDLRAWAAGLSADISYPDSRYNSYLPNVIGKLGRPPELR